MSLATMPIAFNCGIARTLTDTFEAVRYRQLGSSDLHVSEISLGSWMTYGGAIPLEQAEACVGKAFEVGNDFVGAANVYTGVGAGEGLGQEVCGRPGGAVLL